MKNLEMVTALIAAPRRLFAELEERPRVWFPLLLTIIATVAITVWYYSYVDISWFRDQLFSGNARGAQMTDAQRQQINAIIGRGLLTTVSAIAIPIVLLISRLIESTYYLLMGNLTGVRKPFKHWWSFSWWTGLPSVISVVPAALILILGDSHQIEASALAPLSLNELVFHRHMSESGYSLWTTLSLIHPFMWWLAVVGMQVWSKRSAVFSAIVALLGPALFYGCWAVLALR